MSLPVFPLGLPVRVQLQASQGACWESVFSAAAVRKNDGTTVKGSTP